jgi:hypothetical protein
MMGSTPTTIQLRLIWDPLCRALLMAILFQLAIPDPTLRDHDDEKCDEPWSTLDGCSQSEESSKRAENTLVMTFVMMSLCAAFVKVPNERLRERKRC